MAAATRNAVLTLSVGSETLRGMLGETALQCRVRLGPGLKARLGPGVYRFSPPTENRATGTIAYATSPPFGDPSVQPTEPPALQRCRTSRAKWDSISSKGDGASDVMYNPARLKCHKTMPWNSESTKVQGSQSKVESSFNLSPHSSKAAADLRQTKAGSRPDWAFQGGQAAQHTWDPAGTKVSLSSGPLKAPLKQNWDYEDWVPGGVQDADLRWTPASLKGEVAKNKWNEMGGPGTLVFAARAIGGWNDVVVLNSCEELMKALKAVDGCTLVINP